MLSIFTGKHQPDRDALSAYLDGELIPERALAIEAHVATCAACANVLEGMRDVRAMLRELPVAEAPRSFRLQQADVEAPRRVVPAPPAPLMRLMPALSAAAVIVFAVTVGLDLSGNNTSDDSSSAGGALLAQDSSPEAFAPPEAAPETAQRNAESAADATTSETPPVPSAAGATAPDDGSGSDAAPAPGGAAEDSATQPADQSQMDVEATSADSDDDGGNNLVLRIVEVASAAVALVAAGVALRMWRKRGEAAV